MTEGLWSSTLSLKEGCVQAVERIAGLYPRTRKRLPAVREALEVMCSEFPAGVLGDGPPKGHTVGFDGTPINVSVRARGPDNVDVRWDMMNVAPGIVGADFEARSRMWEAGGRVATRLEQRFGVDLSAFRPLHEIFAPSVEHGSRLMGFASAIPADGPPPFQSYFMPGKPPYQAQKVLEASSLLSLRPFAEELCARLGEDRIYLAVELSSQAEARTKLYVTFSAYDPKRIEDFRSLAGKLWPADDIGHLMEKLYGEIPVRADGAVGPTLAFHFRSAVLHAVAIDVAASPFELDLADDRMLSDGELRRNLDGLLKELGVTSEPYTKALEAYAVTNLEDEVSILQRIGFYREAKGMAVTTYLSPRFFAHRFGYEHIG